MELVLSRVADLVAAERAEIAALSRAVYPPEEWADWPGRDIDWAEAAWCVRSRDEGGLLASYTGVVEREATLDGVRVRIGGVGGIKTHPSARGRGHARAGIEKAVQLFREHGLDFALLVCEGHLVPYYASLGWVRFEGTLLVRQRGEPVPFTFNRAMTHTVRAPAPLSGTIDLCGPPW